MQNTWGHATEPTALKSQWVSVPFTSATARNLCPAFCQKCQHGSLRSTYFKDLLTTTCKTCFNSVMFYICPNCTWHLSQWVFWTLVFSNLASRRHNPGGSRYGVICHKKENQLCNSRIFLPELFFKQPVTAKIIYTLEQFQNITVSSRSCHQNNFRKLVRANPAIQKSSH